jgi:cytochrome c oxidase assembly factor CtaG
MSRRRLVIGAAGVLLGLFGVYRLVTEIPTANLKVLLLWLLAALVIHDGLLSPVVVAVGWAVARIVPARARRYLQAGLVTAGLVTVVAVPLIYRQDTQPAAKAILRQDYGGNLTLLLGIIAAASLLLYAAHVARFRRPDTTSPGRRGDDDRHETS